MKRICILLTTICLYSAGIWACGPCERSYLAEQYNLYRLNISESEKLSMSELNIRDWQKQTSLQIPDSSIREVVYEWGVVQMESLLASEPASDGNKFAEWLVTHNDSVAINCLILAKRSEISRARQYTKWYYPSPNDLEVKELDAIQRSAMAYKGKRLADRFAFQVMRALYGKGEHLACVEYWVENKTRFTPGTAVYRMAEDYAVKAIERIPDGKKIYANIYSNLTDADVLTNIQRRIISLENSLCNYDRDENKPAYMKLYDEIKPLVAECKGKHAAMWYYTGAFVAAKLNLESDALSYIAKAEKCKADRETKDYIRVLKFFIKSKFLKHYDAGFEKYLYGELKWLDAMIENNLSDIIREDVSRYGDYRQLCGYSQYYWSDAMRKILIGELVPCCLKSGYVTRALQYLNYADNCLLNKVGVKVDIHYDKNHNVHEKVYTRYAFRRKSAEGVGDYTYSVNRYDYSNDYFLNLDSIGVKYIERLAYRLEHPIGVLDCLLKDGSYTDPEFLYDIIGTQYLAAMNYHKALQYLSKVSIDFNKSRAVYEFSNRDPFNESEEKQEKDPRYKYHFAKNMVDLEQQISRATNPNDKSDLILKYNRAIINSTRACWSLVMYYQGEFGPTPYYSSRVLNDFEHMYRVTESENAKAYTMYTDPERGAAAYCKYGLYASAAKTYPSTAVVRKYRIKCDGLYDYKITARRRPHEEAYYAQGIFRIES